MDCCCLSVVHRLLYFWAFESAESQVRLYLLSDAGLDFLVVWFLFCLCWFVCLVLTILSPPPPLPLMSGNWSTPGYVLGQAKVYPFCEHRSWLKCHVSITVQGPSLWAWFLLPKMATGFGLGVVFFSFALCLFPLEQWHNVSHNNYVSQWHWHSVTKSCRKRERGGCGTGQGAAAVGGKSTD